MSTEGAPHDATAGPGDAKPPVVITDTSMATLAELAPMVGRYLLVIITLAPAVWVALKQLDLAGLMANKTNEELLAKSVIGLATIGYGLYRSWVKRRKLITTTDAAPPEVGVVKRPQSLPGA